MNRSTSEPDACGSVFVSYRRGNGDSLGVLLGRQLQEDLPGVSVFVDRLHTSSQQDWWARTDAALVSADVFVLGVDEGLFGCGETRDGVEDQYRARTLAELRLATMRGLPIVPVLDGKSTPLPADLPPDLQGVLGPDAHCVRMATSDRDSVDAAREQLATAVWVGLARQGGGEILVVSDGTGPSVTALARWVDAATGTSDSCDVLGGASTPRLAVVRHDDTGQPLPPPTPQLVIVATGELTEALTNRLQGIAVAMPPIREVGLVMVAHGPGPTDWDGPSAVEDQIRRVLGDVDVIVGTSVAEVARAATPSVDAWRDRPDIGAAVRHQGTSMLGFRDVLRRLHGQLLPTERVEAIALGFVRQGLRLDRALLALTDRRLLLVRESTEVSSHVPRSTALATQVKRGLLSSRVVVTAPAGQLRLDSVFKDDAEAFRVAVLGEHQRESDGTKRPPSRLVSRSDAAPSEAGRRGDPDEGPKSAGSTAPGASGSLGGGLVAATETGTITGPGRPERAWPGSLVPAWIDFLVRNATGLALVFGAVGYLLGYLAIDRFASQFGVPASVFSLDFRDYVVLALVNLLFVGVVFAGVAVGLVATDKAPLFVDGDGDFVDASDGLGKWLLRVGGLLVSALFTTVGIWLMSLLVAWIVASFTPSGPSGFETDDFRVFFLLVWAGWSAALVAAGFAYWRRARQASKREPRVLGRAMGLVLVVLGIGIFLATAWRNDLWGGGVEAWAQDLKAGSIDRPPGSGLSLVLQPTRVQVYGAEEQAGITDGTTVIRLNDRGPWAVLLHDDTVSVISTEQLTFQASPIPDIERVAEHPLVLSWYSEGGTRYESSLPGVEALMGNAVTTFDGRTSWSVEMTSAQEPSDPVADAFRGDVPERGGSEWRVSCEGEVALTGTLEGRVNEVDGNIPHRDVPNTLARTVCAASEPFQTEHLSNDFWQWSTDDGQVQLYWQISPRE